MYENDIYALAVGDSWKEILLFVKHTARVYIQVYNRQIREQISKIIENLQKFLKLFLCLYGSLFILYILPPSLLTLFLSVPPLTTSVPSRLLPRGVHECSDRVLMSGTLCLCPSAGLVGRSDGAGRVHVLLT